MEICLIDPNLSICTTRTIYTILYIFRSKKGGSDFPDPLYFFFQYQPFTFNLPKRKKHWQIARFVKGTIN